MMVCLSHLKERERTMGEVNWTSLMRARTEQKISDLEREIESEQVIYEALDYHADEHRRRAANLELQALRLRQALPAPTDGLEGT
jgi:hypothetical protein